MTNRERLIQAAYRVNSEVSSDTLGNARRALKRAAYTAAMERFFYGHHEPVVVPLRQSALPNMSDYALDR